jgi:hypothetical protein
MGPMGIRTQEGSRRTMCPSISHVRRSRLEGVGDRLAPFLCGFPADYQRMPRMKNGTGLPVLEWYALLTEGFQKGRLAQEQQVQTLQNVKRWVSDTLTPMLAVICATPGGEEWLLTGNCQGHSSVERPTPELAQATTHSVSPVCRRSRGQPMVGGLGVSADSPGVSAHAYRQRTLGLAQYQAVHTLPLGVTEQNPVPSHSWPRPL